MNQPTPQQNVPAFVVEALQALDVHVDEGQLAQLSQYLEMLYEANQQMNLTAISDIESAWRLHIIDSLTLLPFVDHLMKQIAETHAEQSPDHGVRIADIGSGGGLPAIPLAITRRAHRFTLIEATGKKAGFLERVAANLALQHVSVCNDRAENIGQSKDHRQTYDIVTCRATGPMNVLLELALPLLKTGGTLLAMKGPKADAELAVCGDALDELGAGEVDVFDAYPEGSERNTVIVCVLKDRPTPKTYPRKPGTPKQSPL
jgi:16S rRNA (guanine527-N7)-methyltransferase